MATIGKKKRRDDRTNFFLDTSLASSNCSTAAVAGRAAGSLVGVGADADATGRACRNGKNT